MLMQPTLTGPPQSNQCYIASVDRNQEPNPRTVKQVKEWSINCVYILKMDLIDHS